MITRNAATDKVDSAVEIGIIEYYSVKEVRATAKYIEYYLSYRKLIAKSYIVNQTKIININKCNKQIP